MGVGYEIEGAGAAGKNGEEGKERMRVMYLLEEGFVSTEDMMGTGEFRPS